MATGPVTTSGRGPREYRVSSLRSLGLTLTKMLAPGGASGMRAAHVIRRGILSATSAR